MDVASVTHGHVVGITTELTLLPGEYITKVEGTCIPNVISRIAFVTNKGKLSESRSMEFLSLHTLWCLGKKLGPYGAATLGTEFILDGIEPGMGLLYLSGKA